jgi:hypothetical protein
MANRPPSFALVAILSLSPFACSSSSNAKKTTDGAVDSGGRDMNGADTDGGDTAVSDAAAESALGECTTDTLVPDGGSGADCAALYMVQMGVMNPRTVARGMGMCGDYLLWVDVALEGFMTLCVYDPTTQQLVGTMQRNGGGPIACTGAGTKVPLSCTDLMRYVPDAGADAGADAGSHDALVFIDAPPDPQIEASLKNGLLGLWPLDGDGKDKSGNGLDLTVVGLSYVTARFNSGLQFTGDITKTASRPMSDPSLLIGRGDYTVSVWVSIDPDKDFAQGILDDGAQAGGNGWGLGTPAPSGAWIFATGNGTFCCNGGGPTGFGWRHLVAERSGETISVYANSETVGTTQAAQPGVTIAAETFRLGTWFAGAGDPLFGIVDDVAIWNRALTAEERSYLDQHPVPPAP